MNTNPLKRGEQIYNQVSAILVPKGQLYCALWPWNGEHKPDCKHILPSGYCTATEREQCLTLKDMLEKANERQEAEGGSISTD